MTYRPRRTKSKRPSSPKFRLTWEVEGEKPRHVKLSEWPGLGIRPDMTFDEVNQIAKHLNSQIRIKKQEVRQNKIQQRLNQEALEKCAFLPDILVNEFEKTVIPKKRNGDGIDPAYPKLPSIGEIKAE